MLAEFERVTPGGDVGPFEHERVVIDEQVLGIDFDILPLRTVEPHLDRQVGLALARGPQVVGQCFDAEGRVARALPISAVLTIVEQILHQPRGDASLRLDARQQFEIVRHRFVFAAVPVPPVVRAGKFEPGGLVLVVLDDVLRQVLHHGGQLVGLAELVQGRAVHRERVDRKLRSIAIQELQHLGVAMIGIDEHHEDEGVEIVGLRLVREFLRSGSLEQVDLLGLVLLEPINASFQHARHEGDVVAARRLQAVYDIGRRVRVGLFAVAGEPTPAAVAALHVGQALHASLHHLGDGCFVEHRIAIELLPLCSPFAIVADLLGVEIRPLVANLLQIETHFDQHFLRDDRRQEATERLLGAAVRIVDQVGESVDHRAGQRRRVANFKSRLLQAAIFRHVERHFARRVFRSQGAGERFRLEHAVDIDGELHLDGVGLFVGQAAHSHDCFAFGDDFDAPIDARFAIGGDFDRAGRFIERLQRRAVELQFDLHLLLGLQVVVNDGRENDFIAFDEESRRLQADDQVLGRDDVETGFADVRAATHRPGANLPGRQILGHVEFDLRDAVAVGFQRSNP